MKRLFILIALLATLTAACSDKNAVGGGVKVDGKGKGNTGGAAFRDTTTTAAPTTVPPATTAPTRTTVKVTTTVKPVPTTQAQQIAITIGIYSDTSGKNQFEPRQTGVQRGAVVRWQNNDTVARSVEDQGGAFKSPSIPPGGFWDYKATTPGKYSYADGTRPYAQGELNVV